MAETVTKGGIMLPEKSQGKVLQATVVAVGPGSVNQVTCLIWDTHLAHMPHKAGGSSTARGEGLLCSCCLKPKESFS